jgi:hypothetical protein
MDIVYCNETNKEFEAQRQRDKEAAATPTVKTKRRR